MAFQERNMANTSDSEDIVDLAQYWITIKRAKWGILLITLVCLLVGVLIARTATPVYQAASKILADPQQPNATFETAPVSFAMIPLFYQTQYEIIQSRTIAESVVDKLELVDRYKREQAKKLAEEKTFLQKIKTKVLGKSAADTKPLTDAEIRGLLALELRSNLFVSGGEQTQIINVSYQSENPKLAADIINTLAQSYIQFGLEARLSDVKDTETWLSKQSAELKDQLTKAENKLREFRIQQGVVDSNLQQQDSNSRVQTLSDQLISAQTQLSSAEELYLQVQKINSDSNEFLTLGPIQQNLTIRQLVTEESRLQSRANELFERYKEKHPKMISARSELKSVKASLASEVQKVVGAIESDYELAKLQVKNISTLLQQEKSGIQSLQGSNYTLTALERDVENKLRIYESFNERLMEANIKGDYTASNIQVIDYASVPKRPISPNVKIIILFATFLGVILGVCIALLREMLNKTFHTPESLEENLNIPSLGITMALKKKDAHGIPEMEYSKDTETVFAECVNTIRTSLQFSDIERPPKTILISSANSSEGKSTLAMNLAAAYSQLGKTLLLEVDLRKPSVAKNLNIRSNIGLTDILSDAKTFDECIVKTSAVKGFSVLPCGHIPHDPIGLLSSQRFSDLLKTLQFEFDHIILDGPPTLPVSDACVIANHVDGVIMAVRAEDTKIRVSKEAVSRLTKLNANVIGAVLTVAEPQKMSFYGDHYHSGEYYGNSKGA
ncbi:polysaccharide biosynthesis tyrosine autokinase [Paraglaciecola sp.]|uniref:GumC family protein n=1 Tax=Paraglaciecola sp. TaxID=1920173 RepID=UPI003267E070